MILKEILNICICFYLLLLINSNGFYICIVCLLFGCIFGKFFFLILRIIVVNISVDINGNEFCIFLNYFYLIYILLIKLRLR